VLAVALAAAVTAAAIMLTDADTAVAVAIGSAAVPLLALTFLFGAVANVRRRFLLASLPEFLLRPVGMLLVVATLAWLGVVPGVPMLLSVFAILCLGVTIIQAGGLGRRQIFPPLHSGVSAHRTRLWRTSAYPLVTISLFTALFADVAVIAATPFLARGDLAVFAICLKISLLIGFAIQVVHQTVMPAVAEDLHRRRNAAALARLSGANHAIAAAMLIAGVLVMLTGDRVLALFGPSFAAAHPVLAILVAGQIVRALAGPASQMLTIVGSQRHVIVACPLALVLLGAANAVLIPHYGMIGAAVAVLIVTAAWSAGLAWMLARKTGLRSYFDPRVRVQAGAWLMHVRRRRVA
jgi:O-antigen/teichoic acid export membrane protein